MATKEKQSLRLDSRDWHDQIARLFLAEDTARFPGVLIQALHCVVPFDYSASFAYRGQERPICTFDTYTPHQLVTDYLEGPYLLDPFYQVCEEGIEPGLYRLRDIAPDRFYNSEYYRSYYRRTGLAEEIGFLVSLPNKMMLVISLMRAGTNAPFSDRDMNKLQKIEPVVRASSFRHWRNLGSPGSGAVDDVMAQPPLDVQVANAFEYFGTGVLTRREREVVRMVLRGHSSESIGLRFQITTGTVKVHRNNIYEKLAISSQSELFNRFLSSLSGVADTPDVA